MTAICFCLDQSGNSKTIYTDLLVYECFCLAFEYNSLYCYLVDVHVNTEVHR